MSTRPNRSSTPSACASATCARPSVYLAVDVLKFSRARASPGSHALAGLWLVLAVGIGRLYHASKSGKRSSAHEAYDLGVALGPSGLSLERRSSAGRWSREKCPVPDYDAGARTPTPGQKAFYCWPAFRGCWRPLVFRQEYLVRRPLGVAITAAEKAELPNVLYDFFAFVPTIRRASCRSRSSISASSRASACTRLVTTPASGARFTASWLDVGQALALGHGHGALPSPRRGRADLSALPQLAAPTSRSMASVPTRAESALVRYGADKVEASFGSLYASRAAACWKPPRLSGRPSFGRSHYGYDVSLDDAVANGSLPPPPGFRDGYRRACSVADVLALDSRVTLARDRAAPGVGGDEHARTPRTHLPRAGCATAAPSVGFGT